MVSKIIFNLNYHIMEKEPVRVLTLFLYNGTLSFLKKRFNHIIVLNLNDKIMEKEPVRVLTPFQCNGTPPKKTKNKKTKKQKTKNKKNPLGTT